MSERVQRRSGHSESEDAADRLESARDRLAEVERRIDEYGEETVTEGADAYDLATNLLEEYVDRATGTGRETFKAYVELEGQFASLVENLPDDFSERDAFESALDALDKRRLSESDFERARREIEPAERFSALIDARDDAADALETARTNANRRLTEIEEEIEYRERLLELGAADLDAPIDRLRDPIERYNDAISAAFTDYLHEASAREVFALLERSRLYPLVPFERPPEDLREYVEETDAGEYAIPKLLEYAEYSRSKLDHYVDDADELKRYVATQRTALQGIDAEALSIDWPPVPAAELVYRVRELRPFAERVGGEDVVAKLRAVRAVAREPDYERLRTAAVAIDQLDEDERSRLADGRVEAELESLRAERERIRETLAEER